MILFRRIGALLSLTAGFAVLALTAATFAQGPKKDEPKKADAKPAQIVRPKWNEKRVAFEMRGKEWRTVFEWLSDQSGLPYASSYPPPAGTFTFVNPTIDGKPYEYTLAEAFDFINDMLIIKTKHILIRRETMITMFPADVDLPDQVIPLIQIDDLKERGKTEIVRTVIKLEGHNSEDVAPRVKSLMGDLGHVTPLAETNQLIVRGPVATIQTMLKIFNPIDPLESAHTYSHQCVYIRAIAARAVLAESLGAQQVVEKVVSTSGKDGGERPPEGGGGGPFGFKGGGGGGGGGQTRQRTVRPHTITADKATNTVIVHGPADKIKQAKDVLTSIDKPRFEGDKGIMKGAPEFKTHDLPSGSAETMLKVLQETYKDDSSFRISVIGPTRLFVNADPQTHWEISMFINKDFQPTVLKSEMVTLNRLDAVQFAETIKGMLPDTKNGAPYIEADKDNNGIRIRGTVEQIKDVKGIIKSFDENPFPGSGTSRTVILDKGSGATVSEALYLLLGKMYPESDIKLFLPSQLDKKIDFRKPAEKKDEEKNGAEKKTPIAQMNADQLREWMYLKDKRSLPVSYTAAQEEKKQSKEKQPAKKMGQLMISGFGNRVLLTSDDPKALDMAQQLIRILVNTEAGPGDFEVVHLRVANAVEIAKIIDEAFNGKAGGGQGGRGGGGPPGLNIPGLSTLTSLIPGMSGGQQGRVENIRIVADPGTNALLVRAKPIDMLTIRRLLDQHLDVLNEETLATIKTHVIGPLKHANAADVADLLRQVYAESMKSSGGGGGGGFGGGFSPFGGPRPSDSGASERRVMLTVGIDNHTNSLYVSCPTTLFNDIKDLVDNVEKSSSEAKQSIKIVPIADLDTAVVQQAIAAVSGQTTATATRRFGDTGTSATSGAPGAFGTSGRGNFGGGFGGFGGGGPSVVFPNFGGVGPSGVAPSITGPGGGGGTRPPFGGGGGGGGGPRPSGGGGGPKGRQSRGPDFFGHPVMDDRSVNVLYDPAEEQQQLAEPKSKSSAAVFTDPPAYSANPLQLTGFQQPPLEQNTVTMVDVKTVSAGTWSANGPVITLIFPGREVTYTGRIVRDQIAGTARNRLGQTWNWSVTRVGGSPDFSGQEDLPGYGKLMFRFAPPGPSDTTLNPPRLGVQVEVFPGLGIAILRANTPADLDAAMQIIELLRKEAQGAKVEIRMVAVRFADVMHITNQLNQLFGRVAFNPNSTVLIGRDVTAIVPQQGGGLLPGGVSQTPVQQQGAPAPASNITFLPQPRLGAILVAAPKSRMEEIVEKIHMLDQPNADTSGMVAIPLKRASAVRVAGAINTFYQTRFVDQGNPPALSQVRIAYDDLSNTVFVQASPNDMIDIRRFIDHIENNPSAARTEVKVVPLRNAVALDLAQTLQLSIANGILTINPQAAAAFGGATPGGGAIPGGGIIPGGGGGGIAGGAGGQAGGGLTQQIGLMVKDSTIVFKPSNSKEGKPIEANILADIRVTADVRTNSLVVSAPEKTMPMMLALIRDLDMPPAARSEINIHHLKRSDATQMAQMLQLLFTGTGALGARTAAGGGAAPGGGVAPGAQAGGAAGTAQQRPPITITIQTFTPEGAPIIDLRVTVDERTNSLIVAGSRNDLMVVDTIIDKIENADVPRRINETVRLRNAQAQDVANAVNDFYTKTVAIYTKYLQGTNSLNILREVVVTAEPISNSLMISATPEYFQEVLRQIAKLDTTPPQVVISVLIAEVQLIGSEEFGVEFGLQNNLVFSRSIVPGNTSVSYATTTPGPLNGFALTSAIPSTVPTTSYGGMYFNNPLNNFQTNTSINPAAYGVQGLNALGVGKVSRTGGPGGFVFTAANDTVNVLIRALKTQERLTILSRPQIMTLDNQAAVLAIGQDIPLNQGSNVTATGVISQNITRRTIGVTLQVTPRITPDGRVMMRVIPEVSSVATTQFDVGSGQTGTALNIQHLETTVSAFDGDTIMLGGLITKKDDRIENKIPWLGDLPGIGAAFRYRTEAREKKELIIIMTPHIVRNREEAEHILAVESRRVDWNVADVLKIHGDKTKNCTVFEPFSAPGFNAPMPAPAQSGTQPHRIVPGLTPGIDSLPLLPRSVTPLAPPTSQPLLQTNPQGPSAPAPQAATPGSPVPPPAPLPVLPVATPETRTVVPAAQPVAPPPTPPVARPVPVGKGGLLKNVFAPWNKEPARQAIVTESMPAVGSGTVTEEPTRPAASNAPPLPTIVTVEPASFTPPPGVTTIVPPMTK